MRQLHAYRFADPRNEIISSNKECRMTGSPVYENWKSHWQGAESDVIFEFPLYSDADAIQELRNGLGPYKILRSLREVPTLQDCPALILRITRHSWFQHEQTLDTIPDEFASLLR
jgi:hypothetical protein